MMLKGVILLLAFVTIVGSATSNDTPVKATNSNRVSARKCAEYSNGVVQKVEDSQLDALTNPGDKEARLGEFPHVVAIGLKKGDIFQIYCAGNLISPRFVLITAHCAKLDTFEKATDTVLIGDISINGTDQQNGAQVPIKRIIVHPDYQSPKRYDDIALLELATDVGITDTVSPACLWLDDDFDGNDKAIVVGWNFANEGITNVLSKQVFSLYSNEFCDQSLINLQNRLWRVGMKDTQMCAEGTENNCKISGSPLEIYTKRNPGVHYIIGILSFGARECDLPDVFIRVSKYVDWIESVAWPGE